MKKIILKFLVILKVILKLVISFFFCGNDVDSDGDVLLKCKVNFLMSRFVDIFCFNILFYIEILVFLFVGFG